MTHHYIKCTPKNFKAFNESRRSADVRIADRDYQIGDAVTLREYSDGVYSGATVSARISWLDDYGCQHGFIALSYVDLNLLVVE